jgi:hypothetical protein
MAEIRINTTGGLKLYDADNSHYAQIVAGTITSNVDAITLGHDTVTIADNLSLGSDSAILKLGADGDATLTHDGTTGLTIAATPISIDATGELHLNSTTGDIKLQDGGTDQIAFDLDGTAGEVIMKPAVDSDDLVISQYDGTEVIRIEDNASLGLVGNKLSIANSSSDVVIKPLTDAKDIIFQQYDGTEVARIEDNATFNVSSAGKFAYAGTAVTATAAELNILDGVTSTAAELNIVDGNTSATSTTIADADRVVLNDNGTMVQAAVTDLKTYIGDAILTQVATLNVTSDQGALTFASCFTSTYKNYFVVFSDLKVATNGADVNMLFHYGDSNGNDSTNHNYSFLRRYPSTTAGANEGNANDIKFLQAQKSGAGRFAHGTMYVFNPLSTTDGITAGTILSNGNTNDGTGAQMTVLSFNMPESGSNSAYTGFQFSASSGDIQGQITVYGIKNPS